jgi:hypothetical protein
MLLTLNVDRSCGDRGDGADRYEARMSRARFAQCWRRTGWAVSRAESADASAPYFIFTDIESLRKLVEL